MSGSKGRFCCCKSVCCARRFVASLGAMPEDLLQVWVLCQKTCCKFGYYARRYEYTDQ